MSYNEVNEDYMLQQYNQDFLNNGNMFTNQIINQSYSVLSQQSIP
jgi:hypothetical protein